MNRLTERTEQGNTIYPYHRWQVVEQDYHVTDKAMDAFKDMVDKLADLEDAIERIENEIKNCGIFDDYVNGYRNALSFCLSELGVE